MGVEAPSAEAAAGSPPWLQIILVVVALFGSGIGAWFTYKAKSKDGEQSEAQKLIDQYQEDRQADRERAAADRKIDQDRIAALETEMAGVKRQNNLSKVYIFALIDHIYKGSRPPPPPMPEGLM